MTMNLLRIIGITVCGGAVCLLLQSAGKRELAILIELAASLLLFAMGLSSAKAQIERVTELLPLDENVALALRMTFIALCMELAVRLCRDAGLNALAQKTELCGKVLLLCLCVPALQNLLSEALSLLS